tara:strand:- start:516 stop:788 length:273 start_codon:yes stop_codon:yes gene_type:complete
MNNNPELGYNFLITDADVENNQIEQNKISRNNKIVEAIQLIAEARDLVYQALEGSREDFKHFEAYGSYGLDQAVGEGNPYDSSLHSLLKD